MGMRPDIMMLNFPVVDGDCHFNLDAHARMMRPLDEYMPVTCGEAFEGAQLRLRIATPMQGEGEECPGFYGV
jgi:hypothetical protein